MAVQRRYPEELRRRAVWTATVFLDSGSSQNEGATEREDSMSVTCRRLSRVQRRVMPGGDFHLETY